MSPQLDAGARRRALDALAFAPGRAAADAVAVAAVAGPEDLRGYAGWWVEHRSGNDWRDYGLNISTGTLADAERAWASEVMGEGTADFDVELDRVSMAWLVVTNGGDGNSCDWAAWIDPRVVMADGREVSLSSGWVEARAEWGSVNSNRDPPGRPARGRRRDVRARHRHPRPQRGGLRDPRGRGAPRGQLRPPSGAARTRTSGPARR